MHYDTVENHGSYSNLDYTVEQIGEYVRKGDILIDYSGGTGILAKRLLDRLGSKEVGIVIVDSSPKFLRLALEKFRDEPYTRLGQGPARLPTAPAYHHAILSGGPAPPRDVPRPGRRGPRCWSALHGS